MGWKRELVVAITVAVLCLGERRRRSGLRAGHGDQGDHQPLLQCHACRRADGRRGDRRHREELRPDAVERRGPDRDHQQPRRPPRRRDRGRAERSQRRGAGDEARPAHRLQGHHLRCRFGASTRGRSSSIRRPRIRSAASAPSGSPRCWATRARSRSCPRSRPRPTRTPGSRRSATSCSKPEYKDIEIVDEVYGYDNEQKAFDLTVALTTKYPDLAGIYAPTCPGLPAVARALESVGKGKGAIKLAGMCVPSITAEYMLDGTIQVFYLWDPIKLGYITYYAAKLLRGRQDRGQARRFLHDRGRQQVAGHLHDRRQRRDRHRRSAAVHRGELQGARVLGSLAREAGAGCSAPPLAPPRVAADGAYRPEP